MEDVLHQIAAAYYGMTWIEIIAASSGLLSVWFSKNRSILVYPTGLISVSLYVYICFEYGIYADMGLNIFYTVMSIYGWYRWYTGAFEDDRVVIGSLNPSQITATIFYSCTLWLAIYLLLISHTDSTVPIIDSFTAGFSIIGMYLMAEKKIENWIYWIVVDIVSIPLFWYKGLYLTSLQFFIFCIFAWLGYREWRKHC